MRLSFAAGNIHKSIRGGVLTIAALIQEEHIQRKDLSLASKI